MTYTSFKSLIKALPSSKLKLNNAVDKASAKAESLATTLTDTYLFSGIKVLGSII